MDKSVQLLNYYDTHNFINSLRLQGLIIEYTSGEAYQLLEINYLKTALFNLHAMLFYEVKNGIIINFMLLIPPGRLESHTNVEIVCLAKIDKFFINDVIGQLKSSFDFTDWTKVSIKMEENLLTNDILHDFSEVGLSKEIEYKSSQNITVYEYSYLFE